MAELGPETAVSPSPTDSPPAGLPEATGDGPAPDATPVPDKGSEADAAAAAAGEGGPEGGEGASDAGEGEETPPPPAWAEAADVEAVLATDAVAEAVGAREAAARKAGASDTQSRMQPYLQRQEATLQKIDKGLGQFVTSWNEMLEDENRTLSKKDIAALLAQHGDSLQALAGAQFDHGIWEGIGQIVDQVGGQLENRRSFTDRLGHMRSGGTDPTFVEDFAEAVADGATKKIREELKKANATIVRLETEAKTAARDGTKPPAKTGGRAGGGGGLTREQVQKMSPEQISKLPVADLDRAMRAR